MFGRSSRAPLYAFTVGGSKCDAYSVRIVTPVLLYVVCPILVRSVYTQQSKVDRLYTDRCMCILRGRHCHLPLDVPACRQKKKYQDNTRLSTCMHSSIICSTSIASSVLSQREIDVTNHSVVEGAATYYHRSTPQPPPASVHTKAKSVRCLLLQTLPEHPQNHVPRSKQNSLQKPHK